MKSLPESIIRVFWLQESQGDISHAVGLLTTQTAEKEQVPEEAAPAAEHHKEASNQHSSKIRIHDPNDMYWFISTVIYTAQFIIHTRAASCNSFPSGNLCSITELQHYSVCYRKIPQSWLFSYKSISGSCLLFLFYSNRSTITICLLLILFIPLEFHVRLWQICESH